MVNKKVHQPYNRLKGLMREKNITIVEMSRWLGLTPGTVCKKINGDSDFSLSEAHIIMTNLGGSNEIFL